jgi:NAD(P)-dependent dehydrogenase (short-subunit alcohol dehydrogenase family)
MTSSLRTKKIAVVSGGFGYLGFEVVKRLAGDGFSVAILYRQTSPEKKDAFLKNLEGDGHQAYQCDLTDSVAVEAVFARIEQEQGVIFTCVHTAGKKPERKKIHLTTQSEFLSQMEGTLLTSFNFLTASAKKLKEHKEGVLVCVTTAGVVIPEATKSLGAYIPAKYAVQGILTMMRDELSSYGVNVYSVAPGFMAGGMNNDIPQAFVEMIRFKSKTKELTSAISVAGVIGDLCSQKITPQDMTMVIAPEYLSYL